LQGASWWVPFEMHGGVPSDVGVSARDDR
jgi:hypothetical protein